MKTGSGSDAPFRRGFSAGTVRSKFCGSFTFIGIRRPFDKIRTTSQALAQIMQASINVKYYGMFLILFVES